MNQQDLDKANASLIQAAKYGVIEGVIDALSNGADINFQNKSYGKTAIIYASEEGINTPEKHEELMKLLIINGADCRFLENKEKQKYIKYIEGISIPDKSDWDKYLLGSAKDHDFKNVVRALDNGANINVQDDVGNTPLIIAAHGGNKKIVSKLIALGANVNIVNNYNSTALSLSLNNGSENIKEIVAELLNAGADYSTLSDEFKEKFVGEIVGIESKTKKTNKAVRQERQRDFRVFAKSRMNRNR